MARLKLGREAVSHLMAIGSTVERWILRHASESVEARIERGGDPTINSNDIQSALAAFTKEGIHTLETTVFESEDSPSKLRAG